MRVLMLGPGRKDKGGIATVVNQYYDAGLDKRVDLKYITTMHDGMKIKKIFSAISGFIQYRSLIDKYDVIHIHMSSRASFSRKKIFVDLAAKKKKKIIIHIHGSEFDVFYNNECSPRKQEKIRDTFEKADIVIALSEEWKDFFMIICDESKIRVLYNAVVLPDFHRKNFSDHNILFLGRLGKRKGSYDLLEALPKVIKFVPDVKLYYGGDGDIEETKAIIVEKGIAEHTTYLGWITGEEKNRILQKCSVFVLPSYHEGMPMSILEAMSYGEIVVSTYVGGIPKVITSEENGLLFKAGNILDLEKMLIEALIGRNKEQISQSAYQTVNNRFNIINNIDILCDWYNVLIK